MLVIFICFTSFSSCIMIQLTLEHAIKITYLNIIPPCKQKRRVLKLSSGGGVQFDTIWNYIFTPLECHLFAEINNNKIQITISVCLSNKHSKIMSISNFLSLSIFCCYYLYLLSYGSNMNSIRKRIYSLSFRR